MNLWGTLGELETTPANPCAKSPFLGRETMCKFQYVAKSGLLSILAAALISFIGIPLGNAATYTYTLSDLSGTITSNCDNCVLNSSSITAWTLSVPGFLSVASTAPGAQLSVPAGDTDMVATPGGINFQFGGPFGAVVFGTPSGSISYADDQGENIGFGPGIGIVAACDNSSNCMFFGGTNGGRSIASVPVPFAGPVIYSFTGTVTEATGIYASAGTTVTGTFTFDLDAGDGALPVSFTSPWTSVSTGSTPQVVGSTLKSGGVTFSDAGSTNNKTSVAGLTTAGSSAPNEYFASDTEFSQPTNSVEHSFQIVAGKGANAPYNANGMPLFQNATGSGTLLATVGNATVGQLTYTITSLTAVPATLSVSPLSFKFPDTLVNSISAPLTVTLKNTSPNDVFISGITLNPPPGEFQISGDSCDVMLSANASCTISVAFTPFSAGLQQASVTVVDSAQGSPQTVTLMGTATVAPAPVVTLNTNAVSFAGQQVGTASGAKAVTLKNTGNAALSFSSIAIVGSQANDFTLKNACVPSLVPGRVCTLFVTFTPVAAGEELAFVYITDNADGSPQSIALTGTATAVPAPVLTLSSAALNFASQQVETASVKQATNLINSGTAPLLISSIALAGSQTDDFTLQNACVPSLAVGQRCAIFVTFKPMAAGAISASVVITDNAGSPRSIALTGTATAATAPALTLNTASLNFASQNIGTASVRQAFNLTNSGTAPLLISSIALAGSQADDFTLQNACVPSLAVGQHCAVFVTFKPVAAGAISASVVITDNAQGSPHSVALTGTGH
jgi:hypothetical protein